MKIKIEKNVPTPKARNNWKSLRQTIEKMKPGESIVIPHHRSLNSMLTFYRKNYGLEIRSRSICNGRLRIWRV